MTSTLHGPCRVDLIRVLPQRYHCRRPLSWLARIPAMKVHLRLRPRHLTRRDRRFCPSMPRRIICPQAVAIRTFSATGTSRPSTVHIQHLKQALDCKEKASSFPVCQPAYLRVATVAFCNLAPHLFSHSVKTAMLSVWRKTPRSIRWNDDCQRQLRKVPVVRWVRAIEHSLPLPVRRLTTTCRSGLRLSGLSSDRKLVVYIPAIGWSERVATEALLAAATFMYVSLARHQCAP